MKHGHRWLIGALAVVALAAAAALVVPWGQASLAQGDIIYVDADAGGGGNGTSWATAFDDLQDALEAADDGDQIWVAEGTYTPSVAVGGTEDRYKCFQMINGVAIYGGFDPSVGDDIWEERDWEAHETILSGDLSGDDGPDFANNDENSYHVFYHPEGTALDATAILDGFTISGGNANGAAGPHYFGGGMYNEASSPLLANCIFSGNSAHGWGGGVYNDRSSPTLTNCVFTSNLADSGGGGMTNEYSSSILTDCTFEGNSAGIGSGGGMYNAGSSVVLTGCDFSDNTGYCGGGMFNSNSSPSLTNCTFSGNLALDKGGGVWNRSSSPTFTDNTFESNSAVADGGGMYSSAGSSPVLTNCAFEQNWAGQYGGGMFNEEASPTLTNCTFEHNSASSSGGGMINGDSSPVLIGCTFSSNSAISGGGMVNYSDSSATLTNCNFSANSADHMGGGMYNDLSSPTVTNCTFWGNTAGISGGGMLNYYSSSPTVTNCTFSGNSAGSDGGGMYNYSFSSPTVINSILWGDVPEDIFNGDEASSPVIAHSDIQGGCDAIPYTNCGEGNLDEDPLFVDAAHGDLQLGPDSPCIDAGDNHAPFLPDYDFEGDERILDGDGDGDPVVDMGVDEALWYPVYLPVVLRAYWYDLAGGY